MGNGFKLLKEAYKLAKEAKVGTEICCPSCNTVFIKTNYQSAFCKTLGGTVCKDKYWNTVTPTKRNNKTRISPASARNTRIWNMSNDIYDGGSSRVKRTSEGYRIIDGIAYDEFDSPVYNVDDNDDDPSWDAHKN